MDTDYTHLCELPCSADSLCELTVSASSFPRDKSCDVHCHLEDMIACCLQLGVSEDVDMKIRQVREQVKLEAKLQNTLLRLQGSLKPILSVALASGGPYEE